MSGTEALNIPGILAVRDKIVEPIFDEEGNVSYYQHRLTIEWREYPDHVCFLPRTESEIMAATPSTFNESAPPTPLMASNNLSWVDIRGYAVHAIHLLQTEGATAIDAIDTVFSLAKAVTLRDYAGIFTALQAEQANVTEIIAAIKAEFGIV